MPEEISNGIVDYGLLGALLRHKRQQIGFKRAEDFAKAITELVGYPVSKETIYKVESARQRPSIDLYLAMMRVLEPDGDYSFDGLIDMALPNEWSTPLCEGNIEKFFELYPDDYADREYVQSEAKIKKGVIA